MEKLNELLRAYAQSIRRDDGTAFTHADEIRALFEEQAAEPKGLTMTDDEIVKLDYEGHGIVADDDEVLAFARALLANGE